MPSVRERATTQTVSPWRARVVVAILAVMAMTLSIRLAELQFVRRDEFADQAVKQRVFREKVIARPGDLLDREGRLFATTITARSLYVVPSSIPDSWETSCQLAEALGLNADKLFERIASHPDKQFLWVKRRISEEDAEKVRSLKLPNETWGFREEYLRRYPQGPLASHVLGLRDIDGEGRGGLEETLDEILRGKDGWRELIRDAQGRVIDVAQGTEPPQPGQSVTLTLDAIVQLYAERSLQQIAEKWKPKSCCAIVMEPKTGEVLAMASWPTFDPNEPDNVPASAWRNQAIASIYEPGSTFKPCVIAYALQHGFIDYQESFDCEHGEYRMGRRILHDHHPYGKLSVAEILVKSSNIGMAKIGERMTNANLYAAAECFGFGRPTGIELPGEQGGILRPLHLWNSYSTGSIPMGQEIAATPLQVITAFGAVANGGVMITPRIVRHLNLEETSPRPILTAVAVSPEISRWLTREPLADVVLRGTGRKAKLENYTVFGKTGTAQKPDPATGKYSNQLHVSSFVCGAPAEDPQVLVLVTVDEPHGGPDHYGGTVAAPAAREILKQTLIQLRVPPRDGTIRSALK